MRVYLPSSPCPLLSQGLKMPSARWIDLHPTTSVCPSTWLSVHSRTWGMLSKAAEVIEVGGGSRSEQYYYPIQLHGYISCHSASSHTCGIALSLDSVCGWEIVDRCIIYCSCITWETTFFVYMCACKGNVRVLLLFEKIVRGTQMNTHILQLNGFRTKRQTFVLFLEQEYWMARK